MWLNITRPCGALSLACGLTLFLNACGTSPAVEQALSAPLTVPEAVQQTLLDQVEPTRAPRPVMSMASQETIDHRGNFGQLVIAKAAYRHSLTPQGLLDTLVQVDLKEGESTGGTENISLCGLVSILTSSGSSINATNSSVVPVGKLWLPASFSHQIDLAHRGRITALNVKAGRLCAPLPGQTLAYTATFESFYRQKGMFTMSGTRQSVQDVQCVVGPAPQPASELGFEGQYLPVRCEGKDATSDKTWAREYAFLPNAQLYVLLTAKTDWQSSTVKYSQVTYDR